MHDLLSVISGFAVGFVLGLIGGGGSILAVPLLVYVVGVSDPHVAIGTSSVAVAVSAVFGLYNHAHAGNVRWPCAIAFSIAGVVGAAFGSTVGKRFDGHRLLLLFGLLMIVIAVMAAARKKQSGESFVPLTLKSAPRLLPRLGGIGLATGALSGFFGIGGGFLIVPGLVAATDMPLLTAVGSSLVSVAAFGITTAASYAISDLIDWKIVTLFVAGGVIGSAIGKRSAQMLAQRKEALARAFAGIVGSVGVYIVVRGVLG